MVKQTIESLVDAGKASAGPPLGPALGPMGVNVKLVIEEINKKTKEMSGMKVPVKVIIDKSTKQFEIEIGTPPITALIKKELGLQKGSGEAGKARVGDLTEEQVKKIAKIKFGSDKPSYTSQVKGTCRSMGITIGQGAVTKEELKQQEEARKAKEAAAAAAIAATTGVAGEVATAEAAAPEAKGKEAKKEERPSKKK